MKHGCLLLLLLLLPASSFALIDMRNANFSDTWVDLELPGVGYDLKVQRTYNSRSLFNGMFGFGWCSDFETSLDVNVDGTLKLSECGAGMETVYSQKGASSGDTAQAVEKIIAKLKQEKPGAKADYFEGVKKQILTDRRLRDRYAEELGLNAPAAKNGVFYANGKGPESIETEDGQYVRKLPGGSFQKFNGQGQLVSQHDRNGNYLKFSYADGKLASLVDNNGRKLNFSYYPNKKIQKISGPSSLSAEYKFENLNDVKWVKNAWGNEYTYKYDELHNLTEIAFPDKTKKKLSYDKNRDWVMSFADRNGCVETYSYDSSKDDPKNHYSSDVVKKCGAKVTNKSRYEFWYKMNRAKTDKFLAKVYTKINGVVTEVTYHDLFMKPVQINQNGRVTKFEYDEATGLLKGKTEGGRHILFAYETSCSKVNKVTEGKAHTTFKYDGKCNLVLAENSKGQEVVLTYDTQGRIATMTDQAKRKINIRYEERFGKPSFVERPGVGSIQVSYKPTGEIKSIDSQAGPSVAVQVASAFNNLLDIIEPAGVELGL